MRFSCPTLPWLQINGGVLKVIKLEKDTVSFRFTPLSLIFRQSLTTFKSEHKCTSFDLHVMPV